MKCNLKAPGCLPVKLFYFFFSYYATPCLLLVVIGECLCLVGEDTDQGMSLFLAGGPINSSFVQVCDARMFNRITSARFKKIASDYNLLSISKPFFTAVSLASS